MTTTIITTYSGNRIECVITSTNVHISDSYRITKKKDMKEFIAKARKYASECFGYTYNRTEKQWLHEWRAHNLLYKLDYQPERTGSVDLDEGEIDRRNSLYRILSFIYTFIH